MSTEFITSSAPTRQISNTLGVGTFGKVGNLRSRITSAVLFKPMPPMPLLSACYEGGSHSVAADLLLVKVKMAEHTLTGQKVP